MQKKLSKHTQNNLDYLLATVGDMALKRRARKVIEGLELKNGDKVLEVGCGNGYYLSLLNRVGLKLDLVGVDIDQPALIDAVRFIGDKSVKVVLADAAKLPFKSSSFDKIVMSEVIEHVDEEKPVLKEAYRVLKKRGVLTLTTCNTDYPFLWDPINWILQYVFNTHIKAGFWAGIWNQHTRLYKKEQIEKLVKSTGFNVDRSESLTGWCLPFNHYIVNLIAKLFYSNKLPKNLAKGLNKFQNNSQPFFVRAGFGFINFVDKLNDLFPRRQGVSIFIKASRS